MPDLYKTSDGKIHDSIGTALTHQNILDMPSSSSSNNSGMKPYIQKHSFEENGKLGDELVKKGDYDGAIEAYTHSIDYFSSGNYLQGSARFYYKRALAYQKKGDLFNAKADIKNANYYSPNGGGYSLEGSSSKSSSPLGKKALITIGIILVGVYIVYQILSFFDIISF